MSAIFTWKISSLEVRPNFNNMNNVVYNVHWLYSAVDGEASSSIYGSTQLDYENTDPNSFVDYNNLTEEVVIGWLTTTLGQEKIDSYKSILVTQIESSKNPTSLSPQLPWSNQS